MWECRFYEAKLSPHRGDEKAPEEALLAAIRAGCEKAEIDVQVLLPGAALERATAGLSHIDVVWGYRGGHSSADIRPIPDVLKCRGEIHLTEADLASPERARYIANHEFLHVFLSLLLDDGRERHWTEEHEVIPVAEWLIVRLALNGDPEMATLAEHRVKSIKLVPVLRSQTAMVAPRLHSWFESYLARNPELDHEQIERVVEYVYGDLLFSAVCELDHECRPHYLRHLMDEAQRTAERHQRIEEKRVAEGRPAPQPQPQPAPWRFQGLVSLGAEDFEPPRTHRRLSAKLQAATAMDSQPRAEDDQDQVLRNWFRHFLASGDSHFAVPERSLLGGLRVPRNWQKAFLANLGEPERLLLEGLVTEGDEGDVDPRVILARFAAKVAQRPPDFDKPDPLELPQFLFRDDATRSHWAELKELTEREMDATFRRENPGRQENPVKFWLPVISLQAWRWSDAKSMEPRPLVLVAGVVGPKEMPDVLREARKLARAHRVCSTIFAFPSPNAFHASLRDACVKRPAGKDRLIELEETRDPRYREDFSVETGTGDDLETFISNVTAGGYLSHPVAHLLGATRLGIVERVLK